MKAVNREMTDRQPRTREQRRADTLTKLSAPAVDGPSSPDPVFAARISLTGGPTS